MALNFIILQILAELAVVKKTENSDHKESSNGWCKS